MPKRSIFFSILCIAALIAFICIGIYPNYITLKDFQNVERDLKDKIKLQQSIMPVYMKLIERTQIRHEGRLFLPDMKNKQGISTQQLIQVLRKTAKTCAMEVDAIIPDAASYSESQGKIWADTVFRGDFKNFYPFLTKIGGLPFIEEIESFEIKTAGRRKILTLRFLFIHKSINH